MSKYVREIDSIQQLRNTPTSDAAAAHVRTPTGKSGMFVPMDGDPFGNGDDGTDVLQASNGTWWVRQATVGGRPTADNLASGTIPDGRFPDVIPSLGKDRGGPGYRERLAAPNAGGGSGTLYDPYKNGGLQTTFNNLVSEVGNNPKILNPGGSWEETLTLNQGNSTIDGRLFTTRIRGSGGHVIDMQTTDHQIQNLWIDSQDDTDTYACIFLNTQEATLRNLDIEPNGNDPFAGLYLLNASEVKLEASHIQSASGSGYPIYLEDSSNFQVSDLDCSYPGDFFINCNNQAVKFIKVNGYKSRGGITIKNNGSPAQQFMMSDLMINGQLSIDHLEEGTFEGVFFGGTDISSNCIGVDCFGNVVQQNCFLDGTNCTHHGNARDGADVIFGGNADRCAFHGVVNGNVEFRTGATDCRVYGVVSGTVSNSGTNCSVV